MKLLCRIFGHRWRSPNDPLYPFKENVAVFDPTCFLFDSRFGYIVRHEGCDYMRRSHVPFRVRINPLRLEIGIGRSRPCAIVINKNAWMQRRFSNFLYRLRHPA